MSEYCKHGIRDLATNLPYCRRCDAEAKITLAPASGSVNHLDGYRAAEMIVAKALDVAQNQKPQRWNPQMRKLAAYRQGYYDGLLLAHCQHALGAFPEKNQEAIRTALSPND